MKRILCLVALAALSLPSRTMAQDRTVQTTPYTRILLRSTNAAHAKLILEIGQLINSTFSNSTFAGTLTNINVVISGTEIRTNYTTHSSAIYSASGLLFATNGAVTLNLNGPAGLITALKFGGAFVGDAAGLTNANATTLFASGTVPAARLGSGSSITTKYLRGDNTWQTLITGGDMLGANNLSDVAVPGFARSNIFAHIGDNITAGTVAALRLGSGSSITTKFLRGDNTWQSISAGDVLPITATTYLATNTTSGGWLLLTKEPDGTWSLQWSAANGFAASKLYADPSTGTLHVDCDPFTFDHGVAVTAMPDNAGLGNQHYVTWSADDKKLYRDSNPGRITANQLIVTPKVAPTSSQTNFTLSFTNSEQVLFSANTNVNVSFTDLVTGGSLTWRVDALTSSVNAVVTIPATVVTNSGLILTVTNGTARVFHASIPYGALVNSNLWITGGDVYRR